MELTKQDHDNLDAFLNHALDDFEKGRTSKEDIISALTHLVAAAAIGNEDEVHTIIWEGRKHLLKGRAEVQS